MSVSRTPLSQAAHEVRLIELAEQSKLLQAEDERIASEIEEIRQHIEALSPKSAQAPDISSDV